MEECPNCGNPDLEEDEDGDSESESFGEMVSWCEKCGWSEWDE